MCHVTVFPSLISLNASLGNTFFRTGSIDIEVLDGNPLITTLDGECSPQLRMHAEIAHSAARILLPPELAANANKTPVLQAMGE